MKPALSLSRRDSADLHTRDAAQPGDFNVDMIDLFRGNGRDSQLVN
jgi:hypothetical protein